MNWIGFDWTGEISNVGVHFFGATPYIRDRFLMQVVCHLSQHNFWCPQRWRIVGCRINSHHIPTAHLKVIKPW